MKLFHQVFLSLMVILTISCSGPKDYDIVYTWSPVSISSDIEDSENIEKIIAPYRSTLDSIMDEVIGYAAHDLTTRGQYESTLGTFVTKLSLDQSISFFEREVDAAIMNHHGGLRAPINEGPITLGEVFQVMPFENEIVLLEISGNELVEVIKYIGETGRSMIWPVSFHVSSSGIENIRLDGKEIESEKSYVLSISDYLANGGSGFHMLTSLKRLDVTPIKLRDMIVKEIRDRTARGDSIRTDVSNFITTSD